MKKLNKKFSAFNDIFDDEEKLIELAKLVDEMSHKTYQPDEKYHLMYKVIKIGVLAGNINPIPIKSAADTLKYSITDLSVKTSILSAEQQLAILKLCRNMAANFFHIMYEDKTKKFLVNFIEICKGIFNKNAIFNIYSECNKVVIPKLSNNRPIG